MIIIYYGMLLSQYETMIKLQSGNYLGQTDKFINTGEVLLSITSYPDTDYSESLHYHEPVHISFILSGGNLEKRCKNDIERLPGVTTFYHAGEIHQSIKTKPLSKNFNIEIEDAFFNQYELEAGLINPSVLKSPDAAFLMLKILSEWQVDTELSKTSVHALILNFFQGIEMQNKSERKPSWIKTLVELLNDKWDEPISLTALSKVLNIHPVTISKCFPKYFGCTLGEYVRKIKIKKALILIQTSPYSLTKIAVECGFADQSHFIRAFKQQAGFLPNRFKKITKC